MGKTQELDTLHEDGIVPRDRWFDLSGVRFERYQPQQLINVTRIAAAARAPGASKEDQAAWAITWRCFKRNRPGVAELLQDPELRTIAEFFDADICIPVEPEEA